jgi:predicted nucleotidyltransferase
MCYDLPMSGNDVQTTQANPAVLERFRQALADAYGDRLERVILFGSRARGDARPDSDYDVAVFIHAREGFAAEAKRLALIETDILDDTGALINALPFHAGAYQKPTRVMAALRRDGIDL